mgnify:CR=1 FL=1
MKRKIDIVNPEEGERKFILPYKIGTYLNMVSAIWMHQNPNLECIPILNYPCEITLGVDYDNWNGGTYGHQISFYIPVELFIKICDNKIDTEKSIMEAINLVFQAIPNEFIHSVEILLDESSYIESQNENNPLLPAEENEADNLWKDKGKSKYRIFLSHKTDVKENVARVKKSLESWGCSCFVAHEDIEPTKEWAKQIELALRSMDAFVALVSTNYHTGAWTDQEIGFALCRKIPCIAVMLCKDSPLGLLSVTQALRAVTWENCPEKIFRLFLRQEGKIIDSLIDSFANMDTYADKNSSAQFLKDIKSLNSEQKERLVRNHDDNYYLQRSVHAHNSKISPEWTRLTSLPLTHVGSNGGYPIYKFKVADDTTKDEDIPF